MTLDESAPDGAGRREWIGLGAVGTAVYRAQIDDEVPAAAQDTLAATISAAVAIGAAILAAALLQRVQIGAELVEDERALAHGRPC